MSSLVKIAKIAPSASIVYQFLVFFVSFRKITEIAFLFLLTGTGAGLSSVKIFIVAFWSAFLQPAPVGPSNRFRFYLIFYPTNRFCRVHTLQRGVREHLAAQSSGPVLKNATLSGTLIVPHITL